jgi:ABC-2 type transport system ATP-binding protein
VIEVKALTKTYESKGKAVRALDNVSFACDDPGATALLGPNGAGKTTLLRIVSTVLIPTSGEAYVNGSSVTERPADVRKLIGLVTSSERAFYFRLTGIENLLAFGILYNFTLKEARRRAIELLEMVGLSDWADVEYMKYSLGMQRRLALARALFHDPPVLLLDEPTLGIDVESARNVIDLALELARQKTLLFTSHNMGEVQRLASRVCLINDGRLLAQGTLPELRASNGLPVEASMEDVYVKILGADALQHGPGRVRGASRRHE